MAATGGWLGGSGGPPRRRLRERYFERRGMAPPVGLVARTVEVGGVVRTYWVAPMPTGDPSQADVLVVLHGAGGQGPGMAALSGLDRRGPAAGFVTVFPDGVGRVWSDARQGRRLRRRQGVDDVGFIRALVAQLRPAARRPALYLAGMSNGSLLAEHIARHGLVELAGMALVAGPGTQVSRAAKPRPARPTRVVIFAGTADPLIPYGGGPIGPLGRVVSRRDGADTGRGLALSAETCASDWAAANGIVGPPVVDQTPAPPGDLPVTCMTWTSPGALPVVLYRIEGGGHTWPGAAPYLPERIIGRPCRSLDATGSLLRWFRTPA